MLEGSSTPGSANREPEPIVSAKENGNGGFRMLAEKHEEALPLLLIERSRIENLQQF